jgi:outer membrane lipoprotein LolB
MLAPMLALLLSACATVPADGPPLSGRLSVQVAATADAPARGFHAGFDLWGDGQRGRLDLSTPLGPRLATATWAPGEVRLDGGQGVRAYPSLEALSVEVLGEALPLQALPDWLRGRPWPGAAHTPLGAPDDGFVQLGWRIDGSLRGEGVIVARRAAQAPSPAVTLRVRLSAPD